MSRETPTILDAGHSHTIYGLGNLAQGQQIAGTAIAQQFGGLLHGSAGKPGDVNWQRQFQLHDATQWRDVRSVMLPVDKAKQNQQPKKESPKVTTRLVQVFIADPNENIPLDDVLLYRGEQKLTDATDQELFYEIDIKSILDAHNAKRIKLIDKKVKERTEHLEPAKIRDLKMVVVTIAQF